MRYCCLYCRVDPQSHSFAYVGQYEGSRHYYTCPANARMYNDSESIVAHYDGILSEDLDPTTKWVWIFDAHNFGAKHMAEPFVAINLAKLINDKFYSRLNRIYIINSSPWIQIALRLVRPFLPATLIDKIYIVTTIEHHPFLKNALNVLRNKSI